MRSLVYQNEGTVAMVCDAVFTNGIETVAALNHISSTAVALGSLLPQLESAQGGGQPFRAPLPNHRIFQMCEGMNS